MRQKIILLLLSFTVTNLYGNIPEYGLVNFNQKSNREDPPKMTCIYCGGTGMAGFMFCLFCNGSGRMTDPEYLNQKAEEMQMGTYSNGGITIDSNSSYSEIQYREMYSRWKLNARSAYESLTTLGYRIKENGNDVGGSSAGTWGSTNYSSIKRNLRAAQSEMRKIRMQAMRNGYNIPQSNYETITVTP